MIQVCYYTKLIYEYQKYGKDHWDKLGVQNRPYR
jgi:hypothetical protein